MQNITTANELKLEIQLLEVQQALREQLIKDQFQLVYESYKPINLLKNALKSISGSPNLFDNILGSTVGMASGFISKKIVVGTSGNLIRKLLGSLIQVGVTKVVATHPEVIKSIGQFLFQHIFSKNRKDHKNLSSK